MNIIRARGVVSLVLTAVIAAQDPVSFRVACERAAAATDGIDYGDVYCGRYGGHWQSPGLEAFVALCARADPVESVVPLLAHADARVRTLTMLVLFDREDAKLLPHIAALTGDAAPTMPMLGVVSGRGPRLREPTTVGRVAQELVNSYLIAAGARNWDEYWKQRQNRTWCASWLAVRLQRATGCVSPIPVECQARIAAVRAAVDRLPPLDRDLLLVTLPDAVEHFEDPRGMFATPAQREAAARSLGDAFLLQLLAGAFTTDDPDARMLGRVRGFDGYSGLHRFLLAPDRRIFSPAAAPRLLELEARQREQTRTTTGAVAAGWVTTAASLQPDHAEEWLRAAFDRFTAPHQFMQRAELMVAAAKYAGAKARPWLVEKFWAPLDLLNLMPPPRTQLLEALAADGGADARATLRAVVGHQAFATVDGPTLVAIVRAANIWSAVDIVGEAELRSLTHPTGIGRADVPEMLRPSPEVAKAYLATLERWRTAVSAQASKW